MGRRFGAVRPSWARKRVGHDPNAFFLEARMKYSIDWPPGFTSRIVVDPKTKRFETPYAAAQRCRTGGGFDVHTISQPGNVEFVQRGPVKMMKRAR